MVKKKRYVDVRVMLWLLACIILLVFYIITYKESPVEKPFEEHNQTERLNIVNSEEQTLLDSQNLEAARNTGDRAYCITIKDQRKYRECVQLTSEKANGSTTINEQDVVDKANMEAAKIFNDPAYCRMIVNEQIMAECKLIFRTGG